MIGIERWIASILSCERGNSMGKELVSGMMASFPFSEDVFLSQSLWNKKCGCLWHSHLIRVQKPFAWRHSSGRLKKILWHFDSISLILCFMIVLNESVRFDLFIVDCVSVSDTNSLVCRCCNSLSSVNTPKTTRLQWPPFIGALRRVRGSRNLLRWAMG